MNTYLFVVNGMVIAIKADSESVAKRELYRQILD